MSTALLLLVALAEPRLSVTTVVEPAEAYVHQPVRVTLRIEYDEKFFRESGVQMFSRELDLPIKIEASWLEGGSGSVSLALNDDVAFATRAGDGVVVIERVVVPDEAGAWELAAPVVRFAFASEFREDFIHGRLPVDRKDVRIEGEPVTIPVLALPAAGRPPSFFGAVGRFDVHAATSTGEVDAGAIFQLIVRIEGEGNLAGFDPPRLTGLTGFHVYGALDDYVDGTRTITYDVAALDPSVGQVPPIPFWYFDPDRRAYRVAESAAIPLRVRGRPEAKQEPSRRPWLVGAGLLVVLIAVLVRLRRRREKDPVHAAAEAFAIDGSFADFLAKLLACAPPAVIGPELASRLEDAGVEAGVAARAAALMEKLVASRYGGDPPGERERAEASAIVETIVGPGKTRVRRRTE